MEGTEKVEEKGGGKTCLGGQERRGGRGRGKEEEGVTEPGQFSNACSVHADDTWTENDHNKIAPCGMIKVFFFS